MSLQNKLLSHVFRRISGVVVDATTGKTGIKTGDGVFSINFTGEGKDVEHTVSLNLIDALSFNVPGFASQVPFEKVKAGDIVVGAQEILGFVVGKTGKALKLADTRGMTKTYTPPKVEILGSGAGANGVMVVQSLFSLTGSADGAAGLGSILPLVMLMGDDNGSIDKILPFILMQGASGKGAEGLNNILPLLLLSKGGLGGGSGGDSFDKLLPLLALSGGLGGAVGGAGGLNPMMLLALSGKGGLGGLLGDEPGIVAPALQSNRNLVAPALRRSGY